MAGQRPGRGRNRRQPSPNGPPTDLAKDRHNSFGAQSFHAGALACTSESAFASGSPRSRTRAPGFAHAHPHVHAKYEIRMRTMQCIPHGRGAANRPGGELAARQRGAKRNSARWTTRCTIHDIQYVILPHASAEFAQWTDRNELNGTGRAASPASPAAHDSPLRIHPSPFSTRRY